MTILWQAAMVSLGLIILIFPTWGYLEHRINMATLRRVGENGAMVQLARLAGRAAFLDLISGVIFCIILLSVLGTTEEGRDLIMLNTVLFIIAVAIQAIRVAYVRIGRQMLLRQLRVKGE